MTKPPVILRAVDKLLQVATQAAGRAGAAWRGAEVHPGAGFVGPAIVTRAPGSRIVIEARVVLCSWSRWTALGVSPRVVLRTLTEGAVVRIGRDAGISGASICLHRRPDDRPEGRGDRRRRRRVMTGSVPARTVAVGNPATVLW